jgi:sulfite reductase (NADPH) hemoprotein beta-component
LQDDRDQRAALKKAGKEKAFGFMLRVRLPGGRATPGQWLVLDKLSEELASPSLRLTTRQTFQFHGILKGNVKPLIQGMHRSAGSTACGDGNWYAWLAQSRAQCVLHGFMTTRGRGASSRFQDPSFTDLADEELVAGGDRNRTTHGSRICREIQDSLCGASLKRRRHLFAGSGFSHYQHGQLAGYNVLGGGMGMNHGNVETFPRLADVLGFIPADQVNAVGRAVLITQREHGDRTNRRHARLKYTIEDRGVDWFKAEVERLSHVVFAPARSFEFATIQDPHGWHNCADGTWFYGLHILSGRIKDIPGWHEDRLA